MNKLNNKKIIIDNIKFDSMAEGLRYQELKILERIGEISYLTLQPKFVIQDAFVHKGRTYQAITYTADFQYKENGKVIVEDFKGMETQEFKRNKKFFIKMYCVDNLIFRVSKKGKRSFTFEDF